MSNRLIAFMARQGYVLEENSFSHYGVKGMKWGFSFGLGKGAGDALEKPTNEQVAIAGQVAELNEDDKASYEEALKNGAQPRLEEGKLAFEVPTGPRTSQVLAGYMDKGYTIKPGKKLVFAQRDADSYSSDDKFKSPRRFNAGNTIKRDLESKSRK